METMIFLVGFFLIGSGIYTGEEMQYFFGGVIVCGSIALHFVRKKDWKKHWEEQELYNQILQERLKREEEEKRGEQK
jgi:hypothetical protein